MKMNGTSVGIILTIAAAITAGIGVFSEAWWIDHDTGNTYTIFTAVNCNDDICGLGTGGSDGWIIFAQFSGVLAFLLLCGSLLFQITNCCCKSRRLLYIMVGLLCLSCLVSLLHTFVIVKKYHQLTAAYVKQIWLPKRNGFLYQTLPTGLIAVSGSLCVPACIAIVIYRMKQIYDYKKDPKNPNRIN